MRVGLRTLVRGLIFGKDADRRRRSAKAVRIRALPDRRVMADSYVPALAADGGPSTGGVKRWPRAMTVAVDQSS